MRLKNDMNIIQGILTEAKKRAVDIRNKINLGNFSIKDKEFLPLI